MPQKKVELTGVRVLQKAHETETSAPTCCTEAFMLGVRVRMYTDAALLPNVYRRAVLQFTVGCGILFLL